MKKILFISLILITLGSCTKIIELDLNDDENLKVVVDAQFSTFPTAHEIKLTQTANYFSGDAPLNLSGAIVTITDGINVYPFNEVAPGIYQTLPNVAAIPERNYTLNITHDGKTFTAQNYCDSVPELDSLVVEPFIKPGETEIDHYKIKISTQEKPGFGDYYAWKIYVNGTLKTDTITELNSTDDAFFPDGFYFNLFELTRRDDLNSGDTVMVAQHAISKETYDTYFAILMQTAFRGSIFDTPPANVPTNLSEGAVGLFTVTGEARRTVIVP